MMPGIVRQGDVAGGTVKVGSSSVFVNGLSAVPVGTGIEPHGSGAHKNAVLSVGSSTVFVNGSPVTRAGDTTTCGHVPTGSPNVSAGG